MRESMLIVPPNDLLRHPLPNRIYHLARRFAKRFHIYLLSYPGHPLRENRKLRNLNCTELSFYPVIRTRELGLYYVVNAPQVYRLLSRVMEKGEIDVVVHANIIPSYLAIKVAKRYGVPTVYDFLDFFPESASAYYSSSILRGLSHAFVQRIVKINIKNNTRIVTISYTFKKLIRKMSGDETLKINVIPNGIDHEVFRPIPMETARRELGLDCTDDIVLYYGSLDAWVDLDMLFNLLKKFENLKLMLIGVSHNPAIKRRINETIVRYDLGRRVIMFPPQPYEMVPLFIASSNIIIAPYKKIIKNFVTPLKIIESLACGRPTITSDIPEFRIWFSNTPLYYYRNQKEISSIVRRILKNYDSLKQELMTASDKLRARFSWDALSEEYLKAIEGLL